MLKCMEIVTISHTRMKMITNIIEGPKTYPVNSRVQEHTIQCPSLHQETNMPQGYLSLLHSHMDKYHSSVLMTAVTIHRQIVSTAVDLYLQITIPLLQQALHSLNLKNSGQIETNHLFFYLTDLDKSTDNSVELDRIKHILRESDSLDKKIEEEKLRILKDELELSLLTTQCERDYLNVQLTQEKLDSLLMQG